MKKIITLFVVMLFSSCIIAQVTGDYRTRTGTALSPTAGNWSDNTMWQDYDVTTPGIWSDAAGHPDATTANVEIREFGEIVLDANYSVKDLTISSGGKLTAGTATTRFAIVYGNVVCNGQVGDGANNDRVSFAFEKAGTQTISGSAGVFDAYEITKGIEAGNASTVQVQRDINLRNTGTAFLNKLTGGTTLNLTIDAGYTVDVKNGSVSIDGETGTGSGERGGTITVNGTLLVDQTLYLTTDNAASACAVTIGASGTIECANANTVASGAGGHTFTINSGGLLKLTDGNLGTLATGNNTYTLTGEVEYSKAGAQTVSSNGAPFQYGELTFSGSGIKTLGNDVQVNTTLKLAGTATAALGGNALTYSTATLEYAGSSGQTVTAGEWGSGPTNITINNPSGVSLDQSGRSIGGVLTINSGKTFNAGGYTFAAEDVTNNGIYSGAGVLTVGTSNTGTLAGTGSYVNLTIGGSTTLASGNTTVTGIFALGGGTFTNSSTIILDDGMTVSRSAGSWGTLGTVTYSGTIDVEYTGAVTTGLELPSSTTKLNDLTIGAVVVLGANVTVNGTLTLNNTFTIDGRTLTVLNPIAGTLTSLDSDNTANITIKGTVSGIFVPGKTYDTITIVNTNGATLADDATASDVVFTSGDLMTANHTLTLAAGGTLTGESAGQYLIGTVKTTSADTPVFTKENIGIDLTITTGTGVVLTRTSGDGAAVSSFGNQGMNRKYSIAGTGMTFNNGVTLRWVSDDLRGLSTSNVSIYQYREASSAWEEMGPIAGATEPVAGTYQAVSYNVPNITNVSIVEYTITDNNNPLPVELVSFDAQWDDETVTLLWETATEVDNYGFEIYRSEVLNDTERSWELIGFVEGHGNASSPKNYSYVTEAPLYGTFAYQLKQIDFDGDFEYFDEVQVSVGIEPEEMLLEQNYPNPFNPKTQIRFALPEKAHVTLAVFNILGEQVAELVNAELEKGIHQQTFDASNLTSGIYIYMLRTNSVQLTRKMLVMK